MITDKVLQTAAAAVARRYARRVWWADESELRQEALVAAYEVRARGTYDPTCNIPLRAYVERACAYRLRAYLWRQSAPVSAPHRKLTSLAGLHRAALDECSATTETDPLVLLCEKEHALAVRTGVEEAVKMTVIEWARALVLRVLLGDEAPSEVADGAVMTRALYRMVRKARVMCETDSMLYDLWRNEP